MENERRNFLRYRMKENVFAAVNSPETIVGKVKDMSLGGAAFEFIGSGVDESKQFGRYSLDVFMLGSSGVQLNMPCKIFFREPPLRSEKSTYGLFPGFVSHICVGEFKDLTQPQARTLLDFIMRNSVGYAT